MVLYTVDGEWNDVSEWEYLYYVCSGEVMSEESISDSEGVTAGATSCTGCAVATYSEVVGSVSSADCVECPTDLTTTRPGAASADFCTSQHCYLASLYDSYGNSFGGSNLVFTTIHSNDWHLWDTSNLEDGYSYSYEDDSEELSWVQTMSLTQQGYSQTQTFDVCFACGTCVYVRRASA
jgi:hypothetical protein